MNQKDKSLLQRIEWIPVGVIMFFVVSFFIWAMVASNEMGEVMSSSFSYLTKTFGWLYLLVGFLCVVFAIWLAFGPFGNVKLGKDDSKPEYSFFSWFAMIFACGYGIGIIYWGAAEPLSFLASPPFGLTPGSAEAAETAMAYAMFHWGFSPWAMYLSCSIPLGYFIFRRGLSVRFSAPLEPILKQNYLGVPGQLLDSLMVFGIMGSVFTSVGLGIMQVSSGLYEVFGIETGTTVYLVVGLLLTVMIAWSASGGIQKGIKLLSEINLPLAVVLMLFVLLAGPTVFALNLGSTGFGEHLNTFFKMSFWTDNVGQSGFPQGWTVFYWGWWLSYAPLVGLFVANISKGRTIKEVVLAHMVTAPVATWLWFVTFGGTAIHMELFDKIGLLEYMSANGTESVIYRMLQNFPFFGLVGFLFIVLMIIFIVTGEDSASLVLAQVVTKTDSDPLNPPKLLRIFFAVAMCGTGIILVLTQKGITGLQMASVVTSFPLLFIVAMMAYGLIKTLYKEEVKK